MNLARPRRRAAPHGMRVAITELARLEIAEVEESGRSLLLYRGEEPAALQHLAGDADRLDRFLHLMPDNLKDLRVLELGANPYILIYALARRGVSVVANGLPLGDGVSGWATESVRFSDPRAQTVLEMPLVRFNVKSDAFPVADESFDVVICGELIEHLTHGHYAHVRFRTRRREPVFLPSWKNVLVRRIANRWPRFYERHLCWIFPAWYLSRELEVVK